MLGESVKMPLKEDEETANVQFYVFTIDNEKFVKGYETLKSGQMEITDFIKLKFNRINIVQVHIFWES